MGWQLAEERYMIRGERINLPLELKSKKALRGRKAFFFFSPSVVALNIELNILLVLRQS